MCELIELEITRSEALRKLGRNIVNFSKIEGGFKLLLSTSQVSGTTATLSSQILTNQCRLRKQSLGKLVDEFNENIVGSAKQTVPPENLSEPWISVALTVDLPEGSKAWKQILKALVAERNQLIHHKLSHFDVSSVEDYRELISYLDEQNPRLLAHLGDLRWMLELLSKTVQEVRQSPEFLQLLSSSPKESSN